MELCIIYFLLHTSLFPLHFLSICLSHFPSSLCFSLLSLFLSFPSLCTFNFSVPSSLCLYSTCPFYLSFSLSYLYLQLFPLPLLVLSICLSLVPFLTFSFLTICPLFFCIPFLSLSCLPMSFVLSNLGFFIPFLVFLSFPCLSLSFLAVSSSSL